MSWRVTALQSLEQAAGVGALFREVYGDGYPVGLYYNAEELWQSHQSGQTLSAIALDEKDQVMGHSALYHSTPNLQVLELGAGLVHSSARRSGCSVQILEVLLRLARERQAHWVYAEAVCNHVATQKTLLRAGFVATAIEVDLMPAAAYTKEASASGRVSALLSFLPLHDVGQTVILPRRYRGVLEEIYEALGIQRKFNSTPESDPPQTGQVQDWHNPQAGLLRMTAHAIGGDLDRLLGREAEILQVILPLDSPHIDYAIEVARGRGFFLAGLLPAWSTTDCLMLQRVATDADWSRVSLQSDFSKELLEVIKVDAEPRAEEDGDLEEDTDLLSEE